MDKKLVKGDRVTILEDIWPETYSKYATIWGPYEANSTGAGSSYGVGAYKIRIDGYDYRANEDNCHTISADAVKFEEPSDDEILALFGLSK